MFETLAAQPIAVYYNYAVHAVITGKLDRSAATFRARIALHRGVFDDEVVAVWSSGAAGDQNPTYSNQTYEL